MFISSGPGNQSGGDPNRQVMTRFALRLAVALAFVVFLAPELRMLAFSSFMVIASLITGLIGLIRQEPFNGPTLNHWDEALAFLAMANLAGAFTDPQTLESLQS